MHKYFFVWLLLTSPCFGYELGGAMFENVDAPLKFGVIFSAAQAEQQVRVNPMIGVQPPYWEPSTTEVSIIHKEIVEYLKSLDTPNSRLILKNIHDYRYQYLGYVDDNDKWVLVNCFCSSEWKESNNWKSNFVFYLDGGSCYFQLRFNVKELRFERLQVNGGA